MLPTAEDRTSLAKSVAPATMPAPIKPSPIELSAEPPDSSADQNHRIRQLHVIYCRSCGELSLRMHRFLAWSAWLAAGHSEPDLRLVLGYLKDQIRRGDRNPGALKLSNLLNLDRFEEDLLLARRHHKLCAPPSLAPSDAPTPPPRSHADLMRHLQILRSWRDAP
ncbi:MAG: hypothetical protein HC901_00380 [Bdellovibrionaceae bacterium]|nr:hypothetical protein [Pseudobdellovibrionaceae bacterium]